MTGPQDAPQPPTWATPGSKPGSQPGATPAPAPPQPPAQPDAPSVPGAAAPAGWSAAPGWGTPPGAPPAPGAAPAGPPSAPPPPGPHPAAPGPYPMPPGAGYGYGPAGATPWRPPALQPGIIPLRPLNVGEILDGSFRAVRANPAVMFGLSAIVMTVTAILQAVLTWYVGGQLTPVIDDAFGASLNGSDLTTAELTGTDSSMLGASVASVAGTPLLALATTLLTGLLIVSVSRSVLGRKVTIGEVLRSRQVWKVVGFTLLVGLVTVLAAALVVVPLVLAANADSWGGALAIGLLGGLALVVAGVWVSVRTLLVTPALMLEGRAFWPTVARGWRLTRGSFWRLLGIYLLISIIVYVIVQLIQFPVTMVVAFAFGEPFPTSFWAIVATSIGQVLANTISTVFTASVVALLYIDTRMRREGLDIELARAAEKGA
ncbi:glycerophosphoryl diester phosphodiesterase membrane domain-containing protein [Cellulomonas sp.]|uniref:glycerophosphoryl diester phosphodiesterase membrane domain-containing protein n=1 Tax=Cellulomonas sp. TaxID=40001 RepID=UPI00258309ED|nr:glycerophosphoryl diester phosphodiesterase membrane domain-containing protein [Cellulomonas sp.]